MSKMNFFNWTTEANGQVVINELSQISPVIEDGGGLFWDDYYAQNVSIAHKLDISMI